MHRVDVMKCIWPVKPHKKTLVRKSRNNRAGLVGKWMLKRCVCVRVYVCVGEWSGREWQLVV